MGSDNKDIQQMSDIPVDNDLAKTLDYLDYDTAYKDIASAIEGLFRVYRFINNAVDDYTFGMFHSSDGISKLEHQVQVLSQLLSKMSERIKLLAEGNVKSLESQLEVIRQIRNCEEDYEDFDLF